MAVDNVTVDNDGGKFGEVLALRQNSCSGSLSPTVAMIRHNPHNPSAWVAAPAPRARTASTNGGQPAPVANAGATAWPTNPPGGLGEAAHPPACLPTSGPAGEAALCRKPKP